MSTGTLVAPPPVRLGHVVDFDDRSLFHAHFCRNAHLRSVFAGRAGGFTTTCSPAFDPRADLLHVAQMPLPTRHGSFEPCPPS